MTSKKLRCMDCGDIVPVRNMDIIVKRHGKEMGVCNKEIGDKPYWEKSWSKRIYRK